MVHDFTGGVRQNHVVPGRADRSALKVDGLTLFNGELASLFEDLVEQESSDSQTGRGSGVSDGIEHGLERMQWLSSPVDGNLTEEAILDRVVFGISCRIMADQDRNAQFVSE